MKNIIIVIFFFWVNILLAQNVNLETGAILDSSGFQVNTQRVGVSNDFFNFRYDWKEKSADVVSLILPKVFSDSIYSFGAGLIKIGDNQHESDYVIDFFGKAKFKKWSMSLETGRILNQKSIPNDFLGGRFSSKNFTVEAYFLANHSFAEMINQNDKYYGWIAYHPKKFFVSSGFSDKQYWFFSGTKDRANFGNFLLANYNPKNGDFWFRNQSGFGKIDKNFFNQDLYIFASSYLVVPAFHFTHFSPIATKGSYSFKVDGRRINGVHYYELAMGKEIGNNILRMAVGINSEYQNDLRLAPTIEFYKDIKSENFKAIAELRYDFLFKSLSAYLTFKY